MLSDISNKQNAVLSSLNRLEGVTQGFKNELSSRLQQANQHTSSEHTSRDRTEMTRQGDDLSLAAPSFGKETRQSAIRSRIINSLHFDLIQGREGGIKKAHPQSFQWIFDAAFSDRAKKAMNSPFLPWLEGDTQEIYWITGKPGSGKSTLMKFIMEHPHLSKHLSSWSSSCRLFIATFYSWNAGTPLQKSPEGLLRTLLYQIFIQKRQLVQGACPSRWARLETHGAAAASFPLWTWEELAETFNRVVEQDLTQDKLLLLIDGLDEFEDSHQLLVDFIKRLACHGHVKICVSSRPWNIFSDAFMRSPSLKVESLTRDDTNIYVMNLLCEHPAYKEFQTLAPEESELFVREIIDKADGIFLWVEVVVRTLIELMRDGESLQSLTATINGLPGDLKHLYEAIWKRIPADYLPDFSRYFQLTRFHFQPNKTLGALKLWIIDEDDINFDLLQMSETARQGAVGMVRRRLKARTLGLIEVTEMCEVTYLHRSVWEWINQPSVWSSICSHAPLDFDHGLKHLKADAVLVLDAVTSRGEVTLTRPMLWEDIVSPLLTNACIVNDSISVNNHGRFIETLDAFDRNVCTLIQRWGQKEDFGPYTCRSHGARIPKSGTAESSTTKHWAQSQFLTPNDASLMSLLAQWGIESFFRDGLDHELSTSHATHLCISSTRTMFKNAVFGFIAPTLVFATNTNGISDGDGFDGRNFEPKKLRASQRLQMVRLLISCCQERETIAACCKLLEIGVELAKNPLEASDELVSASRLFDEVASILKEVLE
jgi:hypothetical protein